MDKKVKKIKCPWCGRLIELKRGRIVPHIQSPKVMCVGSGQPYRKVKVYCTVYGDPEFEVDEDVSICPYYKIVPIARVES